ncbi:MAG: hypothetical protein GY946_29675 [bacterium]|nr:hypothetical protein [bacterium]
MDDILGRGKVVAPADVLLGLNLLRPEQLDAWRRGQVPYLEQVVDCNLTRLSGLLRILRFHAHDLSPLTPRNARALVLFRYLVLQIWRKWLRWRSNKARKSWEWWDQWKDRYRLLPARVIHSA